MAEKYKHINFKPPKSVADEAKRGLELRKEFGRGGTEVGVARARDLANRKDISPRTVNRMVSYFARHEVDKKGKGWKRGTDGYPSAGKIAWLLWGGDAGRSWVNKVDKQIEAADRKAYTMAPKNKIKYYERKLREAKAELRKAGPISCFDAIISDSGLREDLLDYLAELAIDMEIESTEDEYAPAVLELADRMRELQSLHGGMSACTDLDRNDFLELAEDFIEQYKDNLDDIHDPPSEEELYEAYVIQSSHGGGYALVYEGSVLARSPEFDELVQLAMDSADAEGVYTGLYFINDHGNISALDNEGNEVASWV